MTKIKPITDDLVLSKIYRIRGHRIIIDSDLAELYGVPNMQLKRAVRRNINRFPNDFMFELNDKEMEVLICQIGISKVRKDKRGGTRFKAFAFTEQGVAMLSSVLNSDRAVAVNIHIIRVFTRMRKLMIKDRSILIKLEALEKKVVQHDSELQSLFDSLREMFANKPGETKRIGFKRRDE